MELKIFDVNHGFCACLTADNGNIMLFDCGQNDVTGFSPSQYLQRKGCSAIEYLIIHNFDQDHVSDLSNIVNLFPIRVLYRNNTIAPEQLRRIKLQGGPLTDSMRDAIALHAEYIHKVTEPPIFPNIELKCFFNSYPAFTDTNNLSLVAFIFMDGKGIVFPGDLEKAGWESLLKINDFRNCLLRTNIFTASHHGRQSGYCEDVFNYCTPEIIIISDKEIVHETQKNTYSNHATGIMWNDGQERRYVLTTRSDGMITIANKNNGFFITTTF